MTGFPAGACDTHIHVYDSRHPPAPTATIFPPDAGVAEYRAFQRQLGLRRAVLVQPTTYGLDNTCQIDAATRFGHDARLVVVIDETASDAELTRLDRLGARGVRFHMLPGGALRWASMPPVAERIAPLGWHVQLQMDGNELPMRVDALLALPTPVVVDHVGRFMPPPATDAPAFRSLLALLETGRCWVKLSAPYESTTEGAPEYPAVGALARELVARFPERMLWASNWPHPNQAEPMTPDQVRRLTLDWLPTDELRRQVMVENPSIVYGFERDVIPTSDPSP